LNRKALAHLLAFAGQGAAVLLLLELARGPLPAALTLGGFAAVGAALAAGWRRWAVPHAADMCFGMLTLGNLGMLLGWWADAGFAPLPDRGCPCCAAAPSDVFARPWMWVGMFAAANAAMLWLGRTSAGGRHRVAMFTGGNAGMAAGMWLGGWAAAAVAPDGGAAGFAFHLVGMTAGMSAGMLVGTRVVEDLLRLVPAGRASHTPYEAGPGIAR
jgi:hypothetical protein